MELSTLKKLAADGKIFGVTFVKRTDGSLRRMVARVGVRKGVSGTGRYWDPEEKGLLQVYDMQAQGFRMIPAEGVLEVRAHKERFKV